jgi:hypothetical protein
MVPRTIAIVKELITPAVAPYAEYYLNPFGAAAAPIAERLESNPAKPRNTHAN